MTPRICCIVLILMSQMLNLGETSTDEEPSLEEVKFEKAPESVNTWPNVGWTKIKWDGVKPTLITHGCHGNTALYASDYIYVSKDFFATPVKPLLVQDHTVLKDGSSTATAATFTNDQLVLVISNTVYTRRLSAINSGGLNPATGISSNVTMVTSTPCCSQDQWCQDMDRHLVAYDNTKHSTTIYLSKDAGSTFNRLTISDSFYGPLQGVHVWYHYQAVGMLLRTSDQDNTTLLHTIVYGTDFSIQAAPYEFASDTVTLYSFPESSSSLVWDGHALYYSPNGGQTMESVHFIGTEAPEKNKILNVRTGPGQFVIQTSTNIYWGQESFSPQAAKVDLGDAVLTNMTFVTLSPDPGHLLLSKVTEEAQSVTMATQNINVFQQMKGKSSASPQCPYQHLVARDHGKTVYIDRGGEIHLYSTVISQPWTQPSILAYVTNPALVDVTSQYEDETILGKGIIQQTLHTVVQHRDIGDSIQGRRGHSHLKLSAVGETLQCTDPPEQTVHVELNCPPGRKIKVRVPRLVEDCDEFKNYTYTIKSEVYNPNFLLTYGDEITWPDLEISYDYGRYGCPIEAYKLDGLFKIELDLYDGDVLVGPLNADFVLYEIHGIHEYGYGVKVKDAGCLGNSQSWINMMLKQTEGQRDPNTAWTKHTYKPCQGHNETSAYAASPEDDYQVLNPGTSDIITWGKQAGLFIFKVIVVDKRASFCELETTFALFVEGGLVTSELPSMLVTSCTVGFGMLVLYISFVTVVQSRRLAVRKQKRQVLLEQLDITQYYDRLPDSLKVTKCQENQE